MVKSTNLYLPLQMPRGKLLTEFELGQIQAFRSENIGIREVSRRIGRSHAAVRVRTYLRDPENYGKNMGGRRKSAVTPRDQRAILREMSNKVTTVARIKHDLQLAASKTTIWRVVSTSANVVHAKMKKKPKLTDEDKALRLK
jgi:IS30 family transposase